MALFLLYIVYIYTHQILQQSINLVIKSSTQTRKNAEKLVVSECRITWDWSQNCPLGPVLQWTLWNAERDSSSTWAPLGWKTGKSWKIIVHLSGKTSLNHFESWKINLVPFFGLRNQESEKTRLPFKWSLRIWLAPPLEKSFRKGKRKGEIFKKDHLWKPTHHQQEHLLGGSSHDL